MCVCNFWELLLTFYLVFEVVSVVSATELYIPGSLTHLTVRKCWNYRCLPLKLAFYISSRNKLRLSSLQQVEHLYLLSHLPFYAFSFKLQSLPLTNSYLKG